MVERIMEMTSENLNIDRALIQPTSSFKGDLGIDSLDLFELVMALEEEFDVEIPDRRSGKALDRAGCRRLCGGTPRVREGAQQCRQKSQSYLEYNIRSFKVVWPGWRSIILRQLYRRPEAWD